MIFYVQMLVPVQIPASADVVGSVAARDFDGEIHFEVSFYATEPIELLAPFAVAAQQIARDFLAGAREGWFTHPDSGVSTTVITRRTLEGVRAPDRLPADWSAGS